jgi:hypothetical protein
MFAPSIKAMRHPDAPPVLAIAENEAVIMAVYRRVLRTHLRWVDGDAEAQESKKVGFRFQ